MKVPFKYYLHDNSFYEKFDWAFSDTEIAEWSDEQREELRQKMGRPFYEVEFDCVLDTDTGEVTMKLAGEK